MFLNFIYGANQKEREWRAEKKRNKFSKNTTTKNVQGI